MAVSLRHVMITQGYSINEQFSAMPDAVGMLERQRLISRRNPKGKG